MKGPPKQKDTAAGATIGKGLSSINEKTKQRMVTGRREGGPGGGGGGWGEFLSWLSGNEPG